VTAERTEQRERTPTDDSTPVEVREQGFTVLALKRDELPDRERERPPGIGNRLEV